MMTAQQLEKGYKPQYPVEEDETLGRGQRGLEGFVSGLSARIGLRSDHNSNPIVMGHVSRALFICVLFPLGVRVNGGLLKLKCLIDYYLMMHFKPVVCRTFQSTSQQRKR